MLPVFYSPRMVADSASFSPSARKPELVMRDWVKRKLPIKVLDVTPVTSIELGRVHDRRHVDLILAAKKDNGFGNRLKTVADTLRYTSGSMLTAARYAIEHKTIAAAPCSGFHHAGYDQTAGFCTFNGLMVAATALRHEGLVARVGILDFDMHYGDGTDALIKKHDAKWIEHYTAGHDYRYANEAKHFFAMLPRVLEVMRKCDVVLYQAGADPHVDDPLGGWLTTEQLYRRDQMVFDGLRGTPVAWNLAGGYQVEKDGSIPKVLEIHANTAKAALEAM